MRLAARIGTPEGSAVKLVVVAAVARNGVIGRAGTLAVGVALRDGMPLDRALAHVAAHRPMAGPEVGEQQHLVDVFAARCAASGGGPPAGALRESHPWDPSRDPQRRGSGDGAR